MATTTKKTKARYAPIPLVGDVTYRLRAYEPDCYDGEVTTELRADRLKWTTCAASQEKIADVVERCRRVYADLAPVHYGWSARMLASRDECLSLSGDDLYPAIQRRAAIEEEWMSIVVVRASQLCDQYGLYPEVAERNGQHESTEHFIAAMACGGDDSPRSPGILAMGEPGLRAAIGRALAWGSGRNAARIRSTYCH